MQLPKIFGLPPGSRLSNPAIQASMPLAKITPQFPEFSKGLNIFNLKNAWKSGNKTHPSYSSMLEDLGYSIPGECVTVAFLADNFPTDTFSNEYGESFLEKLTSMSSGIGEIAQMFGAGSMGEITKNMETAFRQMGKESGGFIKTGANVLAGTMGKVGKTGGQLSSLSEKYAGTFTGKMLSTVSQMMAGARVDFPQVWKNSGFQPSYNMTVRLYNPDPKDLETTEKYIIGPIAALALLAIPISEDGNVYNWPYLHKIKSLGIYDLNPAFISNVTIVKGGDQQQISFNQRLGIVDVRLDFGSLYSSMISVKGGGAKITERPTLKTYIDALKKEKSVNRYKVYSPNPGRDPNEDSKISNVKLVKSANISNIRSSSRYVSLAKKDIAESLISSMNI